MYINRNNAEKSLRSFGNVYADVNMVKGLAFSSKINFDINQFKFDEQTESFNQNGSILGNRILLDDQEFSRFARRRNDAQTYIWTNLLAFKRDFGPHTIDAFIGHETFDRNQENNFHRIQVPLGTAVDFENIESYDIIADNAILDAYGIGADSRRMSQFAKVSYDFADKYYIASSIRRDGSSRFGKNNPIGSYYGFIADGIFRTPEEVAVHAEQTGKGLGNIRYRDLNGDGVINQDDRTIIGNPHPDFIYGINFSLGYKRWSFNVFFDGRQGNEMYNAQRELLDFPYFGFNHGRNTLDAWAPDNANSLIPALSTSDVNDQRRPSTYFVEDGSFFRLKNVNLTYSLSPQALDKIGFESASIFIQAENLLNITSFTGFDYEVPGLSRTGIGIAGLGTYPHTKAFSFGLNLNF